MPLNKYLRIKIGDSEVFVSDPNEVPVSIDYALEDPNNFQKKKSAEALSLKIPAVVNNDRAANTFRNADIKDLTEGEIFRSHQPFVVEESGLEILTGKAFLKSAVHNDRPISYTYDLYGDNADWKIDLEEATLYDFLKNISFQLTKSAIQNSWLFDGRDELLPYVFAPVRYRQPMGGTRNGADGEAIPVDDNMTPEYMKPSISKYFILYWAFQKVGYKINSNFLDSDFFRRQVMPWTWGNFLNSDGTKLSVHNFMAKGVGEQYYSFGSSNDNIFWDLKVSNDSTEGAFDNNDDYHYDAANREMIWQYKTPHFGAMEAHFSMQLQIDAKLNGSNSYIQSEVEWFRNGVLMESSPITNLGGTLAFGTTDVGLKDIFFSTTVNVGDTVSAKIRLKGFASKLGFASISATVMQFKTDYFRIPMNGIIDFANFTGFKNYKFLDFFRGIIDEFNLSLGTDPIKKTVTIEPTHPWSADNGAINNQEGYFLNDFIDWNGKEDLSKEWQMDNYNDYNREIHFKYKDDSNDGILKTIQDRHSLVLASGKYVFPPRFKTGKEEIENRFFAPTMHYDVDQWKGLGVGANVGKSPQMVCLVPENISNTSNTESANAFLPKSCYYKGMITGVGAWKFDGEVLQQYPFMFSVNYKAGGENDPILSYSDENINGVIGKGLIKRFYWQRLAIMRNGQYYNPAWFRLKNVDVVKALHREYKSYKGHRWELIQITDYKPLSESATKCLIRKWCPVGQDDFNNTFPSHDAVIGEETTNELDIKYTQLKCLFKDIPI